MMEANKKFTIEGFTINEWRKEDLKKKAEKALLPKKALEL
jgi:hypothetical protein